MIGGKKMKITEFTNKDGETSKNYKPEAGDEIIAVAESVYVSEPRAVIVGKDTDNPKAVNITTRGITATYKGEEIFAQLTEGHEKKLREFGNLAGKKIIFGEYFSKVANKNLVGIAKVE